MVISRQRQWVEIKDDKIISTHRSNADQSFFMTEIPWNTRVKIGEPVHWYGANWNRIPDSDLVATGLRKDYRGTYWNKENYREVFVIPFLDTPPPEGFTAIPPIDGKPNKWIDGGWAVDETELAFRESILPVEAIRYFISGLLSEG